MQAALSPWRSPWLRWLEELQTVSGRTSFPEDPDLSRLRALYDAGVPAAVALKRLERPAPAPLDMDAAWEARPAVRQSKEMAAYMATSVARRALWVRRRGQLACILLPVAVLAAYVLIGGH